MITAITLAFSKFGTWVAANPAVQWILGALAALVGLILWGERRERQGRNREKFKAKERDLVLREKADVSAKQIIEEEKTDADQAIDAGERAVRSEPGALASMSDEEWRLVFGRGRAPGDPGYSGQG